MIEGLIQFDIHEYWHAGSGESGAGDLDQVVVRDRWGLPYLPARSVKGLMRDAVRLAESFGQEPKGTVDRLFGEAPQPGEDSPILPGCLHFENALLPPAFRQWATQGGARKPEAAGLFETLARTAISEVTGTALDHSLRRMEAVMPVPLSARITSLEKDVDWPATLHRCAPLIRNLGSNRHRGLGRCTCSFHRKS